MKIPDDYDWPGRYKEPRDCQRSMTEFDLTQHRYFNLSEMRTGKTAGVLWPTNIRMRYKGLKRVLILAPLSALDGTWREEVFAIMPEVSAFYAIQRSTAPAKEALKKAKHQVFVMNYDKFWRLLPEILAFDPERVIVDESSEMLDPTTRRYKALKALMEKPERELVAMTGTPRPNKPTDVWSMCRLINPDTPVSMTAFRNQTMYQPYPGSFRWLPKPGSEKISGALLNPSIRFRTDDVNDMPEHEALPTLYLPAGKKQAKAFKDMMKHFRTEDRDKVITAQHAGVRVWKLLQITSGVVYDDDKTPIVVGAETKLAECRRLIREAPGKTVIMSRYTAIQHYIIKQLEKEFKIGHINGHVPTKKRTQLIHEFQEGDTQVMVMHPGPTKFALRLDAASQMIWFGPTHSTLEYEQGSARIRGPGSGKTTILKLSCSQFENKIFEHVENNQMEQRNAMDLYRELVLESEE